MSHQTLKIAKIFNFYLWTVASVHRKSLIMENFDKHPVIHQGFPIKLFSLLGFIYMKPSYNQFIKVLLITISCRPHLSVFPSNFDTSQY